MGRPRKRKQELPVETSWRMVEGDHDSFDTSLVPDIDILDDDNALSSGPSNLSQLSQLSVLSSQSNGDWNIGSSQDNSTIQDFITKADDEKNILRSPFAPSVPGAAKQSPRSRDNPKRIEEPEFYMPRIDVDSSRRASSAGSARTIRPNDEAANARQRRNAKQRPPQSLFAKQPTPPPETSPSIPERLAVSLPHAIFDILAWAFGVIGMAFRFAQKPIAVALAIYLVFGALIFASNWLTQSVYTALSPVCNIPGLHHVVDLPFCPTPPPSSGSGRAAPSSSKPVEFDGLMDVQERFEEVLEKSANGVSLPMEMKRSEASVRDLRTMVRYSQLRGKDELVLEFDGFIDTVRSASDDLQRFNVHVGSAVDAVISINRWTSRYLDGLVASADESRGWLLDSLEWLFAPFQPTLVMSERNLLDKYVEHTALVSERISALIDEAYEVLRTLKIAEGHLDVINDFVVRTSRDVHDSTKNDIWLTIFKLVGANVGRMRNINDQLRLLSRVDASRTTAVVQVTELIGDLTKIRDELQELRDAVKEPENVAYASSSETSTASGTLPLSVHIETIDRGVERLEHARRRIRAVENDRIREVMDRGRDGGEKLIESS